jgi:ABC-type lipopolysaccharide export system ATPase subunit
MKDHEKAQLINKITKIAKEFHAKHQLSRMTTSLSGGEK